MADAGIDNLNRNIEASLAEVAEAMSRIKEVRGTSYVPERKEEKKIIESIAEDLKGIGNFTEGMEDVAKEFESIINEYKKSVEKQGKQGGNKPGDVQQRIKEATKINAKLESVKKMNLYLGTQKKWHDAQLGVLNGILQCCLTGKSISSESTSESIPGSPPGSPPRSSSEGAGRDFSEITRNIERNFERAFEGNKAFEGINFKKIFGNSVLGNGIKESLSDIIVGDTNAFRGITNNINDIQRQLFKLKSGGSLLESITNGIFEGQKEYEINIRKALYETAGATKESEKLFNVMSDLGNTVEITGVRQEETLKSIVKLSKMGIKYDGDSEKYKKRILNLSTTTLNTEQQLGLEAGALTEEFAQLYRTGTLNQNSIANLGRGMQEVARTTGISGEQFKKVLSASQGIVDAMRKASTLTSSAAKNIYQLGSSAEKFGVAEKFGDLTKAASSTVNLFKEASDGTRTLLMNAANAAGRLGDLQAGTLLRSKQGIKDLSKGVNQVFKQFGIESADAIDSLSDESKMRLNLVLSSSFNLELGEVKGVLKTLDEAGKTFSDKMIDLNNQLSKNISLEKKTAILEEQRKLKNDTSMSILGALSESAETAKTMDEAFSRFGSKRKEFEGDLKALGIGGSNKDVIRETINQSLTSVNAALSKSGLKEISFSAEEMTKALEDPQAFQNLLGQLDTAQQKTRATGNAQLDAISKTNNALDNLSAIVQNQIAKPLNFLLSSGGITGVVASSIGMSIAPQLASSLGSVLKKFIPSMNPTTSTDTTSTDTSGGGGGGGGSGGGSESFMTQLKKGFVDAEGMGKWAKGWAKFAANLAVAGVLIYVGYQALKLMPDFSTEEIISLSTKVGIVIAAVGAGAALMFEFSIIGKAIEAMPDITKIPWGKLAMGTLLFAAAVVVLPPFLAGMVNLANGVISLISKFGGGDIGEITTASWQLAELMGAGALLIGGIALGVAGLAGLGALATLTGGVGLAAAVGVGMVVVLGAMLVLPAFIAALYGLSVGINSVMPNPKTIYKALDNLMAIMEPAAKLIGYIGIMTALLAGTAIGGIGAGIVGGVAAGIGWIASKATGGINYGNPIEVIEDTLKRSFSLIQGAVTAIHKEVGSLTPEMVQSATAKLESFSGVQSLLGNVLSIYVDKFKEVLPAYIKISKLSNELRYTGSTSADEVADKFRSLTTIVSGIGKIIPDLNNISATLTESQLTSFTNFMNIFSKTALPLFNSLASIDTVVKSDSFKTVTSSQATFKKAGKILENVAPSLRSIMYNIQFVSKTLYEGLAGTPIEQLKEGAEVSSEIIMLFSNFVETVKKTSGSLKPKDMEEFEKVFGDPKIINSLRNVVQNTSKITDIFGQETRSSLDLKYIASNMKNYSEFYGGVSTLLKSYKEIQETVDPKVVSQVAGGATSQLDAQMRAKQITSNAASNFDDSAKTRLTNNITSAFTLVNAFIDAATNQSNLGSISNLPDAISNLKDLGAASTSLGSFLTTFDTDVLKKVLDFSQTLNGISHSKLELGGKNTVVFKGITAIGVIVDDVMRMFSRISEGFTDGLKLINADELKSSSEKIIKISDSIKTLIEAVRTIGDPAEIGKIIKLADSMPKDKPPDLKDKFDNLKAYIDEISRIAAPDFMQSIVAMGRIKGISIESNSGEAIKLISSLTSFITNMQTEFGKLQSKTPSTTPNRAGMIGSAAPSIISAAKIDEVKDFLTKQALPAIKSMEDISKQLSSMPINETMVDDAAKKLSAFGKISSSLSTFNESMFQFQKQWTTKNITNKVNFSPSDVAKKKFGAFAKTNEDLDLYLREQEKRFGYKPEYWDETPFKESNLDAMANIFNDPENKKMFELMGKIPSFYADNVLEPFVNGGGASLSIGGINFVKDAMEGITKILNSFFGNDGVLNTILSLNTVFVNKDPKTGKNKLEKATKILDDFGKDDVFLKFVSSTLENLIFPMLLASKITGGSANLTEGVKSTGQFVELIKQVPVLLNTIQTELSKVGTITDPKSVINNAKTQIDKLGNSLPLLLESLTLNVVIPVLENLLPSIYMEQATKRLGSAMTLVNNINNFGLAYRNIDTGLFSGLDKLSLVGSISKLLNTIDPVEGKLSSFSDKLIFIKDSLQSIADSMNSIVGLNVQGSIIDVLTKIGDLPTNGISAINNAGSNLAKVTVDNFDNIKNKLQLEIMPNKNSPENESLEKLNEKEKTNLEKQDVVIALLKNIHNALTISGVLKGEEPSTYTTSNTGKLGIENVTSNGNASSGNVLNSSSVQASNGNPTFG